MQEPRYRYGEMITCLKTTLKHKHASVRTMGIAALGALMLVGKPTTYRGTSLIRNS